MITKPVDVIYRVWTTEDSEETIALFPELDEGQNRCQSYMHIGQHSPADYDGVIQSTRPAMESDYIDLHRELTESVGYKLKIIKHNQK